MFKNRITIFTGHFGSGKTEISLNCALKLSESADNKVVLVDFDIVNPYFRAADLKSIFSDKQIKIITPLFANTNIDIPAISSEINSIFENKDLKVVFDVGGDDIGAKILKRFKDEIIQENYEMFLVINIKRPMTNTEEKIKNMILNIEHSSGLKVMKLINNTNLLQDTTKEDIIESHIKIKEISKNLKIDFAFTSVLNLNFNNKKENLESNKIIKKNELFYLDKLIKIF